MISTLEAPAIGLPRCEPGLGHLITAPDSPRLIDGVRIETGALWPDDRGWFQELFRFGQGLVSGYAFATTQVSAAVSNPGIVKAFHLHSRQTDCWVPVFRPRFPGQYRHHNHAARSSASRRDLACWGD